MKNVNKKDYCDDCECDPCDCGWGNYIWGISSVGRAPALHAGSQGFKSPILHYFAGVTQLVEYLVANQIVMGSSPITRSIFL